MSLMQAHSNTPGSRMLSHVGIDLQPYVDTIHLGAVETLRGNPDPQVISAGQRALETVIEYARGSSQTKAIVDVAEITKEAFNAVRANASGDPIRAGHNIATIVADLGRTIDAVDQGIDPSPFIEHARSLLNSIPRNNQQDLIEIDLNDRDQLARLLQFSSGDDLQADEQPTSKPDTARLRDRLDAFASHAERLLESTDEPGAIDGMVEALNDLQEMASQNQIDQIGRVVACALRVVESHRATGEPLPLDAVEFVIACRRIIPMILDSLHDPSRVSHAVDALVDQSAFVLLELRRGTRQLSELWPEPDESELLELSNGHEAPPAEDELASVSESNGNHEAASIDGVSNRPTPDEDDQPEPGKSAANRPGTQTLGDSEPTIRIPVDDIEALMRLAGELAIRSGGYSHRARRVLSVSQDINSIGDRLRYLVRGWNDGKYTQEQIQHHLSEITADLGLAASDLDHARSDHIAASERQATVRRKLEQTISRLRSMPLKLMTDPLHEIATELAEHLGRQVELQVEGGRTVVDALHAETLCEALRQLVINAIEHGIEPPDARRRAGKGPSGLIRIKATRDGSQTVIQVIDDGAGMDDDEILRCAEAAGYPVPKRGMTRDRILQYVFLPGFTTKQDFSGDDTGMGLDFVSDAVTTASGTVMVHSELGQGTVFTLRLPVTAMAMPSTIVAVSSERFAIPAASIEQLDSSRIGTVESKSDGYNIQVDGAVYPAADLGAMLGMRSHHHVQSDLGSFLLVEYEDEKWVLRVDRVQDAESITVQPLEREYHHINGVVGTTTLASGGQALVLDIVQVLDASSKRARRFSRQTASLTKVPFALVSDDSISVRRDLATYLESEGWRVLEARDAFEARELLETTVPDLVVVDLDLPAHGGFQISHAARNISNMPIIGLTSRDDPEVRKRAESFEIDAYLRKPLNLDDFSNTLERIVQRQQSGD